MKKKLIAIASVAAIAAGVFVFTRNDREVALEANAPVQEHGVAAVDPVAGEDAKDVRDERGAVDFGADALAVPRAADFKKVVAFNQWAQQWRAADAPTREAMREEGVRLATERRPEFKALIVSDPQRALEQAVPRVILQDLPHEIAVLLERPVAATGDLNVYRGRPQGAVEQGTELTLRYFETPKGESFKARVFGEMATFNSKAKVPLRGVAIDREFAVAQSPVRQLEKGERIPQDAQLVATCPVSGLTTEVAATDEPVTDETPTVEIAEQVIRLCNGTHVTVLDEQYRTLLQASGPGGAGFMYDTYPGTSSRAIGNFRCLYIRITYPDQLKAPNTEDSAYGDMRNVSRFYLESSYGKLTTTSTVTPLVLLPHSQAWYIAKDSAVDGLGLVHSDARAEARKLGYDSNQFDCTIVRVNGGPRLSGISWGGGNSVWVSWDGMDVLNHECGHSLGRNHANYWNTSDGTPYGAGANAEYGNSFDVMGGGGGFAAHYNTISKRALAWLPDAYIHRPAANANGIYRIVAYDQPQLEEGRRYALRVAKDAARNYYIEYHPAYNAQLAESALVTYNWSSIGNAGHLLDTTPGTPGGKSDGGIAVGRTYSDPESDQHFTIVGKIAGTPAALDLAYLRGPFPGNQAPTLTLNASATTIAAGGSVTFTATGSDPDGDTLAYYWDFNDGVASTNTPVFTRTFPSVDQMTVMVTASDMKGRVARRHVVVNAGAHGRAVVTGNVSVGGQPLTGVLIVSENNKYCYTDSAGNYALSDLTTGAHTLTATHAGYTLTAGFPNPITVTTGTNTGNWTGAENTLVTLAKTADATEGGASGSFTFTRTGDTSADLIVRIAPVAGSAAHTTDYTFSPAYVDDGEFRTFTIPAGQSALVVNVVPVNDTSAEGPETVSLQLASNGNAVASTASLAVMTINDNDTALPQVSVVANDQYANEAAGDAGTFTIARTGATTAALNVVVAYSGTATNTADYATLAATVTIPANQSSLTLPLTPVNDTAIEGPEDATITISSNAAYVRDASAQTATINITDDDVPVVSVTALDADASEAARDPGVVLITRTGSTAAPLTVYYGVSGRALHGTDYVALPGQIVMPVGAVSVPVVITPYDDDLGEPDPESVTFSLTTFDNKYSLGTSFSATVNIADNDDTPVVSVRNSATASEPSTAGSVIFRAIGSATGNIVVHYTISGTATAGSDFTAPSGTVTISANGSTDVTVSIPTLDDAALEDTETIVVTITPDPAYRVYNDGIAIIRLKDNDSGERVMVSPWNDSPSEAGATGRFYFSRAGTAGDLVVDYAVSGTAISGTDYSGLTGSVTIPDTLGGVDVTLTPVNDAIAEGTETVTVTVLPGAGYGPELPDTATLYIADNETLTTTVAFASATGATTEAPGGLGEFRDIPVTLNAASANAVTVEYSSGGGTAAGDDTDWAFVDAANGNAIIPRGVLTFPPSTTTQNIRIRVKNDGVTEGSETALITLRNARFAGIGTATHTLTISDANNPVARVRMLVSSSTRAEQDGTEPLLMAVLDRALTTSATVQFTVGGTATAGSDFTLTPGTLTFAAGETVKLLPLTILQDAVIEPLETIVVTLTNPTNSELGAPLTHTVTLRDSVVSAVTISANAAEVGENEGPVQFTVTRAGAGNAFPLTVAYIVAGTATIGTDYAAPSGTVVIPAGADSAPLSIVLVDDATEEPDETIVVTLSPDPAYGLGAITQAATTVLDDDALPVVTITSPVNPEIALPSGVGLMLTAEATRDTPQGTVNLPIVWSQVSGPGTVTFEVATNTSTAAKFSTTTGSYVLRASGTSGTTTATDDVKVNFAPTLSAQDVGTPAVAGSWSESDSVPGSHAGGTITLNGAGTGVSSSGTSDGFYFLAASRTGDFDFAVRIASRTNPGASTSCRVGIMARASVVNNAPYAASFFKGDGTHGYQARLTAGADPYDSVGSTVYTLPQWVRLVRAGDTFAAYYSADGTAWTQRGTTQAVSSIGASPLVGVFITSAVAATPSSAVFDSLNFYLPTNRGPLVDAGAVLTGSGPWNLNATATDDARPVPASLTPLWVAVGGPGVAEFASPSSVDTGVTFSASGAYRLRLTVGDGAITTLDETTATVTTAPLLAWRQTNFGTTAGTGNAANFADMEYDGWVNLVEYALLTSPTQAGGPPFAVAATPGAFILTLSRDPARTDVTITMEACDNLVTGPWIAIARSTNGGVFTSLVPEAAIGETGAGPVAVTATITAHSFFRIKVETVTP